MQCFTLSQGKISPDILVSRGSDVMRFGTAVLPIVGEHQGRITLASIQGGFNSPKLVVEAEARIGSSVLLYLDTNISTGESLRWGVTRWVNAGERGALIQVQIGIELPVGNLIVRPYWDYRGPGVQVFPLDR